MRTFSVAILALYFAGLGCGAEHHQPNDADGDGDADSDVDSDGDVDGDSDPLECGDERLPLDIPPAPIVNGDDSFNSAVVDLTEGQVLAVGALMSRDGGWSNSCTATLVAPTAVLTAAHCVTNFWNGRVTAANQLRFAVGQDVSSAVHSFQISTVHRHPRYRSGMGGNAENDIALLILQDDATEVLPEIEPIAVNCAPLTNDQFVGQDVQNVGYGLTEAFTGWPPPPDNSRRFWAVEEVVELTSFDFIVDGHGVAAVCNGDSGGPSLWTMADGVIRVMGTVSWGDPSCVDEDHFARVDDNCEFLSEFLDPGDPCGGETFEGRCDGDVAIWCEADIIQTRDCATTEQSCGTQGDDHRHRCFDLDLTCDGLSWEGRCDGDNAVWCDDGELRTRRCDDCGQSCGWSDEQGAFYCI